MVIGHPGSPARWEAASGSVRGATHVRDSLPNQDAVAVTPLPDGAGVVLAVADGHGSARCVRSREGAELAVGLASTAALSMVDSLGRAESPERCRAVLADQLVVRVTTDWAEAVRSDAARHPFSDDERARAGTTLGEAEVLLAYGCTLVVAVCSGDRIAVAQIGDGDVVVAVGDEVTKPVPGDERLVGLATTSLSQPDAPGAFRVSAQRVPTDTEALVIVATDGYGTAFADADWHLGVADDFRSLLRARSASALEVELPDWLAESAQVGGDDVTLALAHLRQPTHPDATP